MKKQDDLKLIFEKEFAMGYRDEDPETGAEVEWLVLDSTVDFEDLWGAILRYFRPRKNNKPEDK